MVDNEELRRYQNSIAHRWHETIDAGGKFWDLVEKVSSQDFIDIGGQYREYDPREKVKVHLDIE